MNSVAKLASSAFRVARVRAWKVLSSLLRIRFEQVFVHSNSIDGSRVTLGEWCEGHEPKPDFPGSRAAACRAALRSCGAGDRGGVSSAPLLVAWHLAFPGIACSRTVPEQRPVGAVSCYITVAEVQVRQLPGLQYLCTIQGQVPSLVFACQTA